MTKRIGMALVLLAVFGVAAYFAMYNVLDGDSAYATDDATIATLALTAEEDTPAEADATTTSYTPADEIPAAADADDAQDSADALAYLLANATTATLTNGTSVPATTTEAVPLVTNTPATVTPETTVLSATTATGALDFDGIMMQIDRALAEGVITMAQARELRERAMEIVAQQEVVIESPRFDATNFTRAMLAEHAVVDGQTIDLLTEVFDETTAATNYRPLLFPLVPPVGGHLIDLQPGQVLYLSAGHYQLAMPDGRVVIRAFGEDRVANDYFAMPGRYFLIAYAVTETPERGRFAAIGGAIFSRAPSLAAELQGSFMRPMNLTVSTASHRQASQDGMGKEQSFSLFVDEDGGMRQTVTERLGDRVNIRVIEADLYVGVIEDNLQ